MVTLAVDKTSTSPDIAPGAKPAYEFGLRFIAAALQIVATVAIVRILPPDTAGIYFRGFVIAYGLAALLRGKYELFITHYLTGQRQLECGISSQRLIYALGRRVLIRSAIACACLLVVTADLDIQAPHLLPYLQTYLPFVLAIPSTTFALFMADALRAVNRTLGSILVSTYSMNIAIIAAASLAPPESALLILSWAFLAGSLLTALMGLYIIRLVFGAPSAPTKIKTGAVVWRDIYALVASNGMTGLAVAALQWGPLCVLAVLGSAVQMAEYAVASRTVQIVDFMIPASILLPEGLYLRPQLLRVFRTFKGKLAADSLASLITGSVYIVAIVLAAPWLASQYGPPYSELVALFAGLLLLLWINSAGHPSIRVVTADWQAARIRKVMIVSASVAIILSLVAVRDYGALAIVAGRLTGVLILNAAVIGWAFGLAAAQDRTARHAP